MISLIVCSIDDLAFHNFSENVRDTIGIEYEIVRINNGLERISICQAYNKGISLAKHEILCFVHEDVQFQTPDWGKKVIDIFREHAGLGLLGVAGSKYKAYAPSSWGLVAESRYVNVIQGHKYTNRESFHHYENPDGKPFVHVVCVDGVWMCTTRQIAAEIGFDEKTLTGFHCYDLDFSLSILEKYPVAVTFDILLTHFSEGKNDRQWVEQILRFHEKWKGKLPVSGMTIDPEKWAVYEGGAVHDLLDLMIRLGFSRGRQLAMLRYNNRNKYLNKNFLLSLKIRVVRSWLSRRAKSAINVAQIEDSRPLNP